MDALAEADGRMRVWRGDPGPVAPGSEAHKRLFCRMLLDTHNPYKPAVIRWPDLPAEALARLVALPIWDMAVQTEGRASVRVRAYAESIHDPVLRPALDLDAAEEARHKAVLGTMVAAYGIRLAPEPAYPPPRDPLWAWLITGYSECIDSFFAFGLFETAKRSGYFPPELVDTFEPVMQEEARHILFFVNWAEWYRRTLPPWRRAVFRLKELAVWAYLIWERLRLARGLDPKGQVNDANFTLKGAAAVGHTVSARALLDLCLAENERRMSGYDSRLVRPALVPRLARVIRSFLPEN